VFRKDNATSEESLIGFPTLNVRMNGWGPPPGICEWHVRYKKIDFGQHSVGDVVVAGTRKMDFVEQEKQHRMQNKGISRLKIPKRPALDVDEMEKFSGYKRVYAPSEEDVAKRSEKKQMQYTQNKTQGEEVEGLGFLQEDNGLQSNERR
jgi:tRNA(Ile)-lysidine synthase